jgi:hypothetical protein
MTFEYIRLLLERILKGYLDQTTRTNGPFLIFDVVARLPLDGSVFRGCGIITSSRKTVVGVRSCHTYDLCSQLMADLRTRRLPGTVPGTVLSDADLREIPHLLSFPRRIGMVQNLRAVPLLGINSFGVNIYYDRDIQYNRMNG